MIKTMMFILTGFLALAISLPFSISIAAAETSMDGMRKKRYRYRQRTHRVQVAAEAVPWSQDKEKNLNFDLNFLYGYNFAHFELGPSIEVSRQKKDLYVNAGVWGEFNFIKNTRKKRTVPAIGLKANYMVKEKDVHMAPYLSLKYFPASRTGLVVNLNYDIVTPASRFFKKMTMGASVSVAYVHYFH